MNYDLKIQSSVAQAISMLGTKSDPFLLGDLHDALNNGSSVEIMDNATGKYVTGGLTKAIVTDNGSFVIYDLELGGCNIVIPSDRIEYNTMNKYRYYFHKSNVILFRITFCKVSI